MVSVAYKVMREFQVNSIRHENENPIHFQFVFFTSPSLDQNLTPTNDNGGVNDANIAAGKSSLIEYVGMPNFYTFASLPFFTYSVSWLWLWCRNSCSVIQISFLYSLGHLSTAKCWNSIKPCLWINTHLFVYTLSRLRQQIHVRWKLNVLGVWPVNCIY